MLIQDAAAVREMPVTRDSLADSVEPSTFVQLAPSNNLNASRDPVGAFNRKRSVTTRYQSGLGSIIAASFTREALVAALVGVAAKDGAAMREVYRRTRVKLLATCLGILKNPAEAEDVLQEVYLTIWTSAAQFDPSRASPMTWLTTVARNKAIDKRRCTRAAPLASMDDADQTPDSAPSAPLLVELAETGIRLRREIAGLHITQSRVLQMAFLEEMTHEEIADKLSLPLGTVKSRIRAGLARLRTLVSDITELEDARRRYAASSHPGPTVRAISQQSRLQLENDQERAT